MNNAGSQLNHGGHAVVVSQDIHKRLLEDSSLTGLRLGNRFGVAKRSLPPPMAKTNSKFL